jgi:hypothetical protein
VKCHDFILILVIVVASVLQTPGQQPNLLPGGVSSNAFHSAQAPPGIENFFALGKSIYSGSAPEGEASFEALQKLGVRTIISVDGMKPNVEAASRHGMKYVHLPFGYDGIPMSNALCLVKAARTLPGPIYVHCHHGRHRGPAAAAVICEGIEGWTPQAAVNWLHAAGTATNYAGLYRSVAEFRAPTAEALEKVPTEFPSVAKTAGLVDSMVQIDAHFETLKALRKSGFTSLPEHPDATGANESLILFELFREVRRAKLDSSRGESFLAALAAAESDAKNLHQSLDNNLNHASPQPARLRDSAEAAFEAMGNRCASCHRAFRD